MSSDQTSPTQKRPGIGVGVLVWNGDTLLLGKRIHTYGGDHWQFPGGRIEANETVTECAAREVREETGIEISDMMHSGYTNELYQMDDRQYVTLYVSANYKSGEVKVMEPEKCHCWEWFHYSELPSPLFGPINSLLKQVPDLSVLKAGQGIQASARK